MPKPEQINQAHFGKWLKREIQNREMNCREFARQIGISEPRLWDWMRDLSPHIRGDNIVRIARGLGLSREAVEEKLNESQTFAASASTAAA